MGFALISTNSYAQTMEQLNDKFRQLNEYLPTPNSYRTASGAPGHEYWQQQADYKIDVTLDDENQSVTGSANIRYYNNSPDSLKYIWLQMDQNRFDPKTSMDIAGETVSPNMDGMSFSAMRSHIERRNFDGGFKVSRLQDLSGNDLSYTVVGSNLRIDLPTELGPNQATDFAIDWSYNILDSEILRSRQAAEYFERDDNYIYEIAQWYPRVTVYSDYEGWHNKEYQGSGEFTLEFGNYDVTITAPADHIVASTGVLQNEADVLTQDQRDRLIEARTASVPIFIVTPEEAVNNEKEKASETKTWHYKAENVRDFAFASSRKFIWDAMGYKMKENGKTVMAMSYYPKEGNPLWEQYSTEVVAHTLKSYSKYTFDYPYPVAISVNCKNQGMEYPMICYNFGRPEEDGTYNERTKWGMIGVIIHEVGHNYFPMIVNSDERKWTWMDEGLNTYLEYLTEVSWDRDFPIDRGPAHMITDYMAGVNGKGISPIMTDALGIYQFGNNQYAKAATGLNILRETILGRELMDFAFKTYCERWMFKHPTPADFFRTIEDASGHDLDWFWKGWFYSTDPCDISLEYVKWYKPKSKNPVIDKAND